VVTDPYDNTVGYKVEKIDAEIVSTSHDHYDHNYVDMVSEMQSMLSQKGKQT